MTPPCADEAPACADESLTEAPSRWAGLPSELLIAVVAKHAPHARSLPELLAASRVCRAWAAAFRDDTLWQALHAALSLPAGETDGTAAAARPQPSWRERVAAATLGLSLVDRGTGPGATELPLQEAFGEARILRDAASCVYGGHLCVLSRGRLMVAHLPGLRGVTSVLQSTCADKLTHRTVVPWAGGSVAVTVCGLHPSRGSAVIELTPLACCSDAFGSMAVRPALRLQEDSEIDAMDAAALTSGALLLAVAIRGDRCSTIKAFLITPSGISVTEVHELPMPGMVQTPLLRVDPHSGDVIIAAGSSLYRWTACTHAAQLPNSTFVRRLTRIWSLTLLPDGSLCVAGDSVSGALVLLLPMREGMPHGELPDGFEAVELARQEGVPLWPRATCAAALGAVAVTTGDGDIELFHSRSGRYLGRVFNSPVRGRWRWARVCAAPASCSRAAPGLVSWRTGPTEALLLLHPQQTGGAIGACSVAAEGGDEAAATAVTRRTGWC